MYEEVLVLPEHLSVPSVVSYAHPVPFRLWCQDRASVGDRIDRHLDRMASVGQKMASVGTGYGVSWPKTRSAECRVVLRTMSPSASGARISRLTV